ncbi:hypothetical protein [Peterkaempfera bronchialis]|uniref:Uncharacterized protein n=1 Tax=Peterkaempfera bronchialis TaxID=2126346 RepID=A0A345SXR5_9ACTN|nr:hypothetical protein [Peterkaempfera bronchialis]AXI78520.1 hypothetical protein C7M71_014875 [Peterkaempfera bronchialis]
MTSAPTLPVAQPGGLGMTRPGVLYRCTSYFDVHGTELAQLFDWEVLPNAEAAYKHLRRAAAGVSQALSRSTDAELRRWLGDHTVLPSVIKAIDDGGGYELELYGTGVRMALAVHRVTLLPLLSRRHLICPALILRGRRLWVDSRDSAG